MAYSCFALEMDGGVAHLRMDRPEQLNSMNKAFWSELPQMIEELESSGEVRVIVLSSTGPHFTAGLDLSVFKEDDWLTTGSARDRDRLRRLVLTLQNAFNRLEQCGVPVIAAIQGGCVGGGVDMICACDLRYATSSAFFCIQEINLGMMADLGTLQRLPRLIPEGIVRELAYSGDRLSADRAKSCGLVNEVFETREDMIEGVMAIAQKIAARSPLAVAASKEAITYARDHGVFDSLHRAADLQAAILETRDVMECFQAKAESREPVFQDIHPPGASQFKQKSGHKG